MADHLFRHQHPQAGLDPGRIGNPPPPTRRAEDRISALKDTGMRNLPYQPSRHRPTTLGLTRGRTLPFGEPRGTQPTTWPGEKGFIGGTLDPTGLTHIGAREYDAAQGRRL